MKKVLSMILACSILLSAVSVCFVASAEPEGESVSYDIICDDYSLAYNDAYTPVTQAVAGQQIMPQINSMAVEEMDAGKYLLGEFIISDGVNSTTVKEGESYVMPAGAVSITTVIKDKKDIAFTLNSTVPKAIRGDLVSALSESEWVIYDDTTSDILLDFNADNVADAVIKMVEPQPGSLSFTIALTAKATAPDKKYTLDVSDWGAYFPYKSISVNVAMNKVAAIVASAMRIIYGQNKSLIVTVKNAQGKVLANKKVVITLAGKQYAATTNAKGQAKLALNKFAPGKYTVKVSSEGVTKTTKIVVIKATPKLYVKAKTFKKETKVKKYSVTLKNNMNKPISKAKVTLTINKKTYSVKTNAKGVATFKIKITKKGMYTAVVKYAGNRYYKAVSKKAKVTLK